MNYDVDFVLAEVNADLIRWQKDDEADGGFKKVTSNKEQYVIKFNYLEKKRIDMIFFIYLYNILSSMVYQFYIN